MGQSGGSSAGVVVVVRCKTPPSDATVPPARKEGGWVKTGREGGGGKGCHSIRHSATAAIHLRDCARVLCTAKRRRRRTDIGQQVWCGEGTVVSFYSLTTVLFAFCLLDFSLLAFFFFLFLFSLFFFSFFFFSCLRVNCSVMEI